MFNSVQWIVAVVRSFSVFFIVFVVASSVFECFGSIFFTWLTCLFFLGFSGRQTLF